MNTVFFDAKMNDAERREHLYQGDLFVYSPTKRSVQFCELAREMADAAFAPLDPEHAQDVLDVEEYVKILAAVKPKFIHHPECKGLIRALLADLDCDLEQTYFDVPRLRTMTSGEYLTAGLAYAFHPHRDTWFSAPACQINWWIPVYDIQPSNTIAFHPKYWRQPVLNSSRDYNYQKWIKESRGEAAKQIKKDTRIQPHAEEPLDLGAQVRLVCEAGGIILFSGAGMHSTVPNTSGRTRFSIDFRTVNMEDVKARRGAPNIDSACTGTTLMDFLRGSDYQPASDEVVAGYDEQPLRTGISV